MFIIEKGFAYKIRDNKAYKIDFDENGKSFELKDDKDYVIDKIDKYAKFTYQEIYAKLNVKYYSNLKKQSIEKEKQEKAQSNKNFKPKEKLENSNEE